MTRNYLKGATALYLVAFLAAPALAQERMRSSGYSGEGGNGECYAWATGFEFKYCERMPLPGQTDVFAQVYTLQDGTRRTLTKDPAAPAEVDIVDAAADTGDFLPQSKPVDDAEADRASVGKKIDAATRGRGEGEGDISKPADAVAEGVSDNAGAEEAGAADDKSEEPASEIVAEEFVLPSVVPTVPGKTEIMQVAMGHLNRIETPFENPMVRTSADPNVMRTEFDQNYVYLSVTQPATLFIHDKGHPDPAIVLSVVPRRIAPRQVKVTVPSTMMEAIRKNRASDRGGVRQASGGAEKATAPVNTGGVTRSQVPGGSTMTVADYIRAFSQGRLPKGFQHIDVSQYEAGMFCAGGGVKYSFRQGAAIASNEYFIVRGMVESNVVKDLDERWCAKQPNTLAVAFAPRTKVGPDQPTDFYVLVRRPNAAVKSAR